MAAHLFDLGIGHGAVVTDLEGDADGPGAQGLLGSLVVGAAVGLSLRTF
jgi:hypothetical protein